MTAFIRRAGLSAQPDGRFLSAEECRRLLSRILKSTRGGGDTGLHVLSEATGNVRWARNTIISAGDTTDHTLTITRTVRGAIGQASTNRTDDAALEDCVRRAEYMLRYMHPQSGYQSEARGAEQYAAPDLWSDATFQMDAAQRATLQRRLSAPAAAAGLLSAGYLETKAIGNGYCNSAGLFTYVPETRAEYSVTVRDAKGTGSGWAGRDHLDWRRLDVDALSALALDKCRRSLDPVAVEPGRYTVILEPQAVADLMRPLVNSVSRRPNAEGGIGPWADNSEESRRLNPPSHPDVMDGATSGNSKIGRTVLDPRVHVSADPNDPGMPFVPFARNGTRVLPVTWIEKGVLREIGYEIPYALRWLNRRDPLNNTRAFRMRGGTTSVEEMIASTERGLLVTRLVNLRLIEIANLLYTGTTADGLWLVEKGRITGPVKNFRFRESPLYAFNNLEMLGPATRVFMDHPTIAPAAKIRDFSMTSLADAV